MTAVQQKAISFIRQEIKSAHQLLESTLEGVTSEQVHWSPPGIANPLGATYAHVVVVEDVLINGMMKKNLPLFASTWAGKTGMSELPPKPDPKDPSTFDWSKWGRRVKVDMPTLRHYAQAVYAAAEEYIASLDDDDLNRSVDLSDFGMGESTLGQLVIDGILGHAFTHCGEIACLKGIQGSRGYPF